MGANSVVKKCRGPEEMANVMWNDLVDADTDDEYGGGPAAIEGIDFSTPLQEFPTKEAAVNFVLDNTEKWGEGKAVLVCPGGETKAHKAAWKRVRTLYARKAALKKQSKDKTKAALLARLEKSRKAKIKCKRCKSTFEVWMVQNQELKGPNGYKCPANWCNHSFIAGEKKLASFDTQIGVAKEKMKSVRDKKSPYIVMGGWAAN